MKNQMKKVIENVIKKIEKWGEKLYHTIHINNKTYKGMRNPLLRINSININCKKKRILDLGCNMGGMIWPYRALYSQAIGMEKSNEHVEFCTNVTKLYDSESNIKFINYDLTEGMERLNELGVFDIIFMMSITQYLPNYEEVIKWCHEHCTLLVLEYNGQPQDIEKYKKYTETLRKIVYMCADGYRFIHLCYVPITFKLNNIVYETYEHNRDTNTFVYRDVEKDIVVKVFKNGSCETEFELCNNLECTPDVTYYDRSKMIMVQEFAGWHLNYYNLPDDFEKQIENIKNELIEKGYDGADTELCVNNGKIKLIDLGACQKTGVLNNVFDNQIKSLKKHRDQYLKGAIIS